ncbi:MAG: hypothetical protein EP347_07765 [Alphaproteobacteria bacterium]|nr:MAG: hypothetical protein EP347_07765 [Alphaproteobacteria bacterium]
MESNSDEFGAEGKTRRRDSGYWLIILFAITLTVLWPGALGAFLLGLLGKEALLTLSLEWKVALAVAAFALAPAIWLTAYTWIKARDLAREAHLLAAQSNRLLQPDRTAAQEVATLGASVQKEVTKLTDGIEAALARVADLEARVQDQSDEIEAAALKAEERAIELRLRMEKERDRLKDLADDLTNRTEAYATSIASQAQWMKNVSDEAYSRFLSAADDLRTRSEDFSTVSLDIAAQTREMGASLTEQSQHLKKISDEAFARSEDISKRYDKQRQDIAASTEQLDAQNQRLERVLEIQRDVLAQIGIVVADQTDVLQSTVAKCADDLQEALEKALEKARSAATTFESHIANAAANNDAAIETMGTAMTAAAQKASAIAEETRQALFEETKAATEAVEKQAILASELVGSLFADFESTYRDKAHALQKALGEETGEFKADIKAAHEAAREALQAQAKEARELVKDSNEMVEEASQRLSRILDTLQSTSLFAVDNFNEAAGKLEVHVRQFPSEADAAAAHIRKVIDEELLAFSRLADEASRKIQNLSAAVGRHLPAVRQQLLRPADPPRPSPYQDVSIRGALGQASGEPKSEWAWRELLSKIENGDETAKSGTTPAKPALSESELNKSALLIFESLQSMAIDIDKAIESDPPAELLRRYLNGERALFTKRIVEMTSPQTSQQIHDRYLEDGEFRHNVNQYIEQFESLLGLAVLEDHEDILLDTFLSSHTGKVYLLLGSAVGHFA